MRTHARPMHPHASWGAVPMTHRSVLDIVELSPPTISPETSATEALRVAEQLGTHYLPVVTRKGEPVGVVCRCGLVDAPSGSNVADAARAPAITIDASATPEEAASLMLRADVGCLPVLEEGVIAGMLTRGTLLRVGALHEAQVRSCKVCGTTSHVAPAPAAALCRRCQAHGPRGSDPADERDLGGGD